VKKLRDILIIVVLGGVVLWAVMNFAIYEQEVYVQKNPIVREAEIQLECPASFVPVKMRQTGTRSENRTREKVNG
jgi:hypothetical protein